VAIRAPYVAAETGLKSVTDVCSAPQCSHMMCVNTQFSRRVLATAGMLAGYGFAAYTPVCPQRRTMRGSDSCNVFERNSMRRLASTSLWRRRAVLGPRRGDLRGCTDATPRHGFSSEN